MRPDHAVALAIFILWSLACGWAGYYVTRPADPVPQVYAPEVRTAPNDVALEVKPGATPTLPAPTKPRGGTVLSTTEVTVSGKAPVRKTPEIVHEDGDVYTPATCPTAEDFECPPVSLRLDLIDVGGQQYMAVRSDDGTEVAGQYLPRAAVAGTRPHRATLIRTGDATTLTVTKDAGRLSYGLAVSQSDALQAGVVLGWAW